MQKEIEMQYINKGRKGENQTQKVFIQTILVVSTNEDVLWDACDKALEVLTDNNVVPYYRSHNIGRQFRADLVKEYLMNTDEVQS
jgi:hypothetical protein